MLTVLRRNKEADMMMCKNFVQVSIVTEYNIIFMWPRVTLSYRAWSQFMKPDWDSFFYRSMCAEHKGEHLSFPCVPQAAQPAVTSERSNLFHSIVPSYKSWSPECVRLSVCENIPNTTYQSNQPNHTATHTNTHPVNMEYIYIFFKKQHFTFANFTENRVLILNADKNKHDSNTKTKDVNFSGHVKQL